MAVGHISYLIFHVFTILMSLISLINIRQADNLNERLSLLKAIIDKKINLDSYSGEQKAVLLSNNMLQRITFITGLSLSHERNLETIESIRFSSNHIHDTAFSRNNMQVLWSSLLKLRYQKHKIDWENNATKSRIVNHEMLAGCQFLLQSANLEDWLLNNVNLSGKGTSGAIPHLSLDMGFFDEVVAYLDLNSRNIANTQMLIAGTTGSGKSNLLAVILHEIRKISIETRYPVNFLLFDYKGEFSDPQNKEWLPHFEVDSSAILDPMQKPLPFNPFKDFRGKTQNEINFYATEISNALSSIDRTNISAGMSTRLTEAVIAAYKRTENHSIDFELIEKEYTALLEKDKDDSIRAVLKQLVRSPLFAKTDEIDLIKDSFIIKMDKFPKEGPLAKALVYFTVAKLNTIYESLPKQAVSNDCVELRHFTIIDEAHYMLDFDNRPLKELIAVGRNKGLSIILATQNMESFKSEHFDFLANAQYPLIMKQQTINDKVIKDIFGVTGGELNKIKEAMSNLQKGELIMKNPMALILGSGNKFRKMKVKHLI
jgi:Helicase HerA, central domain